MANKKVLVIGDAHVDDKQNLDRFKALGKMIWEERPDVIVIIGDFLSLNCLSAWDRNKRMKMEGLRYEKELAAGNRALDLMEWQFKDEDYDPVKVYIEGNHEDRLPRYFETDPTFAASHSIPKDLHLAARGWKWVPYKQVYKINGVGFTHIPITGNGKAIGNPNVAQKALKLFATSIVFGHTHTLDVAAEHRHGAPHLNQSMAVGCFFEHVDEYAVGSLTSYWRGVVTLDIYSPNRFDITTTSMRQLKEKYK